MHGLGGDFTVSDMVRLGRCFRKGRKATKVHKPRVYDDEEDPWVPMPLSHREAVGAMSELCQEESSFGRLPSCEANPGVSLDNV